MRVLFASTRGAGHFNSLVPFIEVCRVQGDDVLVSGPPAPALAVEAAIRSRSAASPLRTSLLPENAGGPLPSAQT